MSLSRPVFWAILATGLVSVAHAGERRAPAPVVINSWGYTGLARGALGEVRNSPDSTQYIRCWLGGAGTGGCMAEDTEGQQASCALSRLHDDYPDMVAAIRSIGPTAEVQFRWISGSTCSSILVRYSSRHEPPRP